MNFHVDFNKDQIKQIHVHVHSTKIIIHIDGHNELFDHKDYNDAVTFLRQFFKDDKMQSIIEYLNANLKAKGIDVIIRKPPKEDKGQQLTLF